MAWLPVMILLVFGMVSIAYMIQMPNEKPRHNIKRVIRGNPEVEVVELEPVVEVVEPVVEPVNLAKNNTNEKKTVGIVTVMTKKNKWCDC